MVSVGEDVEDCALLCTVDRLVNLCSNYEKQYRVFSKN